MNKQEAIDKIEDKRTDCDDTIWGGAYDEAMCIKHILRKQNLKN